MLGGGRVVCWARSHRPGRTHTWVAEGSSTDLITTSLPQPPKSQIREKHREAPRSSCGPRRVSNWLARHVTESYCSILPWFAERLPSLQDAGLRDLLALLQKCDVHVRILNLNGNRLTEASGTYEYALPVDFMGVPDGACFSYSVLLSTCYSCEVACCNLGHHLQIALAHLGGLALDASAPVAKPAKVG